MIDAHSGVHSTTSVASEDGFGGGSSFVFGGVTGVATGAGMGTGTGAGAFTGGEEEAGGGAVGFGVLATLVITATPTITGMRPAATRRASFAREPRRGRGADAPTGVVSASRRNAPAQVPSLVQPPDAVTNEDRERQRVPRREDRRIERVEEVEVPALDEQRAAHDLFDLTREHLEELLAFDEPELHGGLAEPRGGDRMDETRVDLTDAEDAVAIQDLPESLRGDGRRRADDDALLDEERTRARGVVDLELAGPRRGRAEAEDVAQRARRRELTGEPARPRIGAAAGRDRLAQDDEVRRRRKHVEHALARLEAYGRRLPNWPDAPPCFDHDEVIVLAHAPASPG